MLEVGRSMRVEILANGRQRRHWSADDRTMIVAEASAAGAQVSVVAREHGLSPGQIFAWRREARATELGAPAAPGLVPVNAAAPGPTATSQQPAPEEPPCLARPAATKKGLIEIDFGGGRRVRVDADVDADALGRVLDVLERR